MHFLKPIALAAALIAVPAAAAPVAWAKQVVATPAGGYLIGNPKAKVKVIEYFSLTCSHCRHFAEEGLPALERDYIAKGNVSLELRNFVLNPFDMAASLLMRCAPPAKAASLFHAAFAEQDKLFDGASKIGQEQATRIMAVALDKRAAALSREAGITRWFVAKGVPAPQAEKCLLDPAGQQRIVKLRDEGTEKFEIQGTPGFVVNGKTVEGADWNALEGAIKAAL